MRKPTQLAVYVVLEYRTDVDGNARGRGNVIGVFTDPLQAEIAEFEVAAGFTREVVETTVDMTNAPYDNITDYIASNHPSAY